MDLTRRDDHNQNTSPGQTIARQTIARQTMAQQSHASFEPLEPLQSLAVSQSLSRAKPSHWPVLVVDDDDDTLKLTKLALTGYCFRGLPIEWLEASSAAAAQAILERRDDIAVLLLDVVMEREDSGLRLVELIRRTLFNHRIRIILRTGEPNFNLLDLVHRFDINDFQHKTELSFERMQIMLTAALRSWNEILLVEESAKLVQEKRIAEAETAIMAAVQERLNDDLARAQQMQRAILPLELNLKVLRQYYQIELEAHFEPAHELAGDYWAIKPLNDSCFALILIDCAGHGVTAALNSFLFHSLFLRTPIDPDDPAASMAQLNRELRRCLSIELLATGILLVINCERNRLIWSGSGWPSVAHLCSTGKIEWLNGSGPLIGPLEAPEFENHSCDFVEGDELIVYSDALIETRWLMSVEESDETSRSRMAKAINAAATLPIKEKMESLMHDCLKDEKNQLRDDLTLIWLKRLLKSRNL